MDQRHILIVDNIKLFRDILTEYLANADVTLAFATNGLEALAQIHTTRPSIIFLDLHMPVMSGDTCCRQLKNDPEFSAIPVIMLMAAGKEIDSRACLSAGCDEIITKPINRRLFLESVSRFISGIDRRIKRYPCQCSTVFSANSFTDVGFTLDLSGGGIYLATKRRLVFDERITLSISIEGESLHAWARVAWCNYGTDRVKPLIEEGAGIEFLDMTSTAAALLRNCIESLEQNS